jgi:hypothetical protein
MFQTTKPQTFASPPTAPPTFPPIKNGRQIFLFCFSNITNSIPLEIVANIPHCVLLTFTQLQTEM